MHKYRFTYILAFLAVALGISACGNGATTIEIRPVGEQMLFEQTEFTVRAGETVRLIMNNTARTPAMSHNVVIVRSWDDVDRVGIAALEAGAAREYVPEDDAIIAYTPMAAPMERTEVTFTAPETPGDYPYICTFPGHYSMMQGVMHVVN